MSLNVRPQDLPEVRAELALQIAQSRVAGRIWPDGCGSDAGTEEIAQELTQRTRQAEMFHVSESMAALAAEAAETLEKFALQPEDLPCADGLMIFDGVAPLEKNYDDGCKNELRGIAWYADKRVIAIPILLPHGWLGAGHRLALEPAESFFTDFGGDIEGVYSPGTAGAWDIFGLLVTAWLLMQQTLAHQSTVEPDRSVKRRVRRLQGESGPVRVIELRRPKLAPGQGDGSREYHHRWITRGHWRQQWYPAREVHRPVWIAPHIKGPEGAPLIGGEKVYAWKR